MDEYTRIRNILGDINDKVRDNYDYKFTEKDLDEIYEHIGIEDPVAYGFQEDETYIAMFIDGMRKGYILAMKDANERLKKLEGK